MIARRATAEEVAHCRGIRKAVFIVEQEIDAALEFDGLDEEARHYIALSGDEPVGTARVRQVDDAAKVERFAVLKAARNLGVGRTIMDAIIEDWSGEPGIQRFILSAQDHAIPFYERQGFVCITDWYEEAGIPHRKMEMPV